MHQYARKDDVTKSIWNAFFEVKSIKEMLSLMFKGEISDFSEELTFNDFSTKLLAKVNIYYLFQFHQSAQSELTDSSFYIQKWRPWQPTSINKCRNSRPSDPGAHLSSGY